MITKLGKIGKANLKANKILKQKFEELDIKTCELGLPGCFINNFLSFAHRHKRRFYGGSVERLSDIKEVLLACINCHDKIEDNKELTNEMFNKLR